MAAPSHAMTAARIGTNLDVVAPSIVTARSAPSSRGADLANGFT
jgi:hypothetical protein